MLSVCWVEKRWNLKTYLILYVFIHKTISNKQISCEMSCLINYRTCIWTLISLASKQEVLRKCHYLFLIRAVITLFIFLFRWPTYISSIRLPISFLFLQHLVKYLTYIRNTTVHYSFYCYHPHPGQHISWKTGFREVLILLYCPFSV